MPKVPAKNAHPNFSQQPKRIARMSNCSPAKLSQLMHGWHCAEDVLISRDHKCGPRMAWGVPVLSGLLFIPPVFFKLGLEGLKGLCGHLFIWLSVNEASVTLREIKRDRAEPAVLHKAFISVPLVEIKVISCLQALEVAFYSRNS